MESVLKEFGIAAISIIELNSFQQKLWRIKTIDKSYILRQYISNNSWWSYGKASIQKRELEAYRLCEKNGIKTPKILNEKDNYVLFEDVEGKPGTEFDRDKVTVLMAKLLQKLHSINEVEGESSIGVSKAFDDKKTCNRYRLLHGDFHNKNVLFIEKDGELEVLAILDFEEATFGNYLWDVTYYLWYLATHVYKDCDTETKIEKMQLFLNEYSDDNDDENFGIDDIIRFCGYLNTRNSQIKEWAEYYNIEPFKTINTDYRLIKE